MTDDTKTIDNTEATKPDTTAAPQAERVTRRDLAEGKIDKILTDKTELVEVSDSVGGLKFDNVMQMAEAAKVMSTAGPMLPPWLQGNVGGCWGIILKSVELQMSPMALASMSYLVVNKGVQQVAYMSNFFRTVVEARAPIKEKRLNHRYEGEGDDRKCFVFATFIGETEPREWPPKDSAAQYTLGKLRPAKNEYGTVKGSPLWETKPDLQLFYAMSRDWARVNCSALIAGMYAREELEDEPYRGPDKAIDVSPKLRERLRGPTGEGFEHERAKQSIEASIKAASTIDPKKPVIDEAAE